ncbi:putative phage protein [Taylorella asinigenitalis MCE3]|uniref:Putative phage protein n=2 Tax=Taylorella asinigenitalis TaxID=84590 RepID=G4QCT8_TAYAM|nr:putative phage protein [Taylorella asinigenitalis MCE3]
MPIQIRAYGLNENDLILVEMIHKGWYSPYCPFNGQSYLDKNKNILLIGLSGRYRFILTTKDGSKPSVGQVLVTHNNVEMSQQVFMAYMSCCGGENGN